MKFRSISLPKPSQGLDFKGIKKVTVPNQSMSLEEILTRFTRGEEIPIGQPTTYQDDENISSHLDVDFEKIQYMDLVDRDEFAKTLKQTIGDYNDQTKARQKRAMEKAIKAEFEKQKAAEAHAAAQSAK